MNKQKTSNNIKHPQFRVHYRTSIDPKPQKMDVHAPDVGAAHDIVKKAQALDVRVMFDKVKRIKSS